jgi:hypothetical protein
MVRDTVDLAGARGARRVADREPEECHGFLFKQIALPYGFVQKNLFETCACAVGNKNPS